MRSGSWLIGNKAIPRNHLAFDRQKVLKIEGSQHVGSLTFSEYRIMTPLSLRSHTSCCESWILPFSSFEPWRNTLWEWCLLSRGSVKERWVHDSSWRRPSQHIDLFDRLGEGHSVEGNNSQALQPWCSHEILHFKKSFNVSFFAFYLARDVSNESGANRCLAILFCEPVSGISHDSNASELLKAGRWRGRFPCRWACRFRFGVFESDCSFLKPFKVNYNDQKRPDGDELANSCKGGGFHSILGDREKIRGTYREIVLFNENQIYPAYICHYKRIWLELRR